jgi:Zn ribbon nucleic-acid-binding protein
MRNYTVKIDENADREVMAYCSECGKKQKAIMRFFHEDGIIKSQECVKCGDFNKPTLYKNN